MDKPKLDSPRFETPSSFGEQSPGPSGNSPILSNDSFALTPPVKTGTKKRPELTPLLKVEAPAFNKVKESLSLGTHLPMPTLKTPAYDAASQELLGKGAFGRAFKVPKESARPAMVVKQINLGAATSKRLSIETSTPNEIEETLSHMEAEAKILFALQGTAHIPRFMGSNIDRDGEIPTTLTIAMEHIDTSPMEKLTLTETEAKSATRQLLETLQAAHAKGIAHLDIKPANMLWDGSNLTLIDWGEARFFTPKNPKIIENMPAGTKAFRPNWKEASDNPVFLDNYAAGKTYEALLGGPGKGTPEAQKIIKDLLAGRTVKPDDIT